MTVRNGELKDRIDGTPDDPWWVVETSREGWLGEQTRLLAAEEGFAD